jgi:hypothetical protein
MTKKTMECRQANVRPHPIPEWSGQRTATITSDFSWTHSQHLWLYSCIKEVMSFGTLSVGWGEGIRGSSHPPRDVEVCERRYRGTSGPDKRILARFFSWPTRRKMEQGGGWYMGTNNGDVHLELWRPHKSRARCFQPWDCCRNGCRSSVARAVCRIGISTSLLEQLSFVIWRKQWCFHTRHIMKGMLHTSTSALSNPTVSNWIHSVCT